jgi:hypothetical protein
MAIPDLVSHDTYHSGPFRRMILTKREASGVRSPDVNYRLADILAGQTEE